LTDRSLTHDRRSDSFGACREERALAWICAKGLNYSSAERVSCEGLDWDRLVDVAARHRLTPVLWRCLRDLPELHPPGAALRKLREGYEANALYALKLTSHLLKISEALSEAGVRWLPLKGVCLAALYYGDVASRHAGDLDLLVPPEELDRADQAIRSLGYCRVANDTRALMRTASDEELSFRLHYIYVSRDGVQVELHFQLHFNAAVLPLDVRDVIGFGARAAVGKHTLPVMPSALQFVFLSTHGSRHEWERLQWVYDIAVMADTATEGEMREWIDVAKRYRLVNPTVQGMILAQRLFGAQVPEEAYRVYRRSVSVRYMVRRAERAIFGRDRPTPRFQIGRRIYQISTSHDWRFLRNEIVSLFHAASARSRRRFEISS
jgi:Uncharacterised nucleotidyltransferase